MGLDLVVTVNVAVIFLEAFPYLHLLHTVNEIPEELVVLKYSLRPELLELMHSLGRPWPGRIK